MKIGRPYLSSIFLQCIEMFSINFPMIWYHNIRFWLCDKNRTLPSNWHMPICPCQWFFNPNKVITPSSRSVSATPPPAPAPRLWAWPAASSPCQTCHRGPCWSQPAIDNNSNNVSISEWERMYKLTWMCWQGCLGSGWKALPGMRARLRWRPRCITISQVLVRVGIWYWHYQISKCR